MTHVAVRRDQSHTLTAVAVSRALPSGVDRRFQFDSLFAIEVRSKVPHGQKESQSDLSFHRTRLLANKLPLSPQYAR